MKCIRYIGKDGSEFKKDQIIRVPDNHAHQWVKKGDWKYTSRNEWRKARTPVKTE